MKATVLVITSAGPITTDKTLRAAAVYIEPVSSNAGTSYFGTTGLVKATGVGVIAEINVADIPFGMTTGDNKNRYALYEYSLDFASGGDGVRLTWWEA